MDALMNLGQGVFGWAWPAVWTLVKIVLIVAPLSGRTAPDRIFIKVDLPAPFSPHSASTLPGATENEMSRIARLSS